MNVASIQGAHTGHLEVLYNAIDKWGQFWLYFWFFLLVQMHVKEYLVKEESSLWDSSLILYHWAEEDSIMSHIHSSILFTYLTLSTLLILSAYRPLVKDSKDIKSNSKERPQRIICWLLTVSQLTPILRNTRWLEGLIPRNHYLTSMFSDVCPDWTPCHAPDTFCCM